MTDFKAPPPPGGFGNPQPAARPPMAPTAPGAPVETPPSETPVVEPTPAPVTEEPAPTTPEPVPQQQEEAAAAPSAKDVALSKFQEQKEKVMGKFNALPSNKKQVVIAAGVFVIGLLMGAIMFGGSSEPSAPAPKGLQGIVSNPDIKEPLKRCGQVEASNPCVLYVMNNYTYEKLAEDFFETAVSVTGRKDRVIRMDNVRYATIRIPPGYFAQIKIPAYK